MPGPTDPPVTDLPDITVTGHRRTQGGSFPAQPPPMYVPNVWQIDPVPPDEGPCDNAASRDEYNSDAAAAKALKKVLSEIARKGEFFGSREYGAILYRGPNGKIDYIRLDAGPGGGYGPPVDISGLDPTRIVGYFHTHIGGTFNPSSADWVDVFKYLFEQGDPTGTSGTMHNLRLYIAAQTISYEDVVTKMFVFKGGNWGTTEANVEVNQEALPCG